MKTLFLMGGIVSALLAVYFAVIFLSAFFVMLLWNFLLPGWATDYGHALAAVMLISIAGGLLRGMR